MTGEQADKIISAARGECRHENAEIEWIGTDPIEGPRVYCGKCKQRFYSRQVYLNYSSAPAAWTPELYEWIENQGLEEEMQYWLYANIYDEPEIYSKGHSIMMGSVTMWKLISSTPLQKAIALAKAIEEAN